VYSKDERHGVARMDRALELPGQSLSYVIGSEQRALEPGDCDVRGRSAAAIGAPI
jgi:hypothetical protein